MSWRPGREGTTLYVYPNPWRGAAAPQAPVGSESPRGTDGAAALKSDDARDVPVERQSLKLSGGSATS